MKLGVVIVTFNRLSLLKEAIEACLSQSYKFERILVVNNASTDGTFEYLTNEVDKRIEVLNLKENYGGAGGFHEGVKFFAKSDLDYLLLIDDDAIIDKEYNRYINEEMKKNNENIIAYSGTVMTENNIQFNHRRFLLNQKKFEEKDSVMQDYRNDYFDYDLSTFCGIFIPVRLIEKIGLPKKEFFIWFDDTEYSLRLNRYGKMRNVNKAFLVHKTSISINSGYSWKSYYGIRNKLWIVKKYFSNFQLFKMIIDIYMQMIGGKIFSIIKRDKYYLQISNMYSAAKKDGLNSNLGRNEDYLPGLRFERRNKI